MAIFIIDQFSLNTNLPLDLRYLPNGGRLDPDISIYKYPGMQVYDTSTQSIWYADNNLNWVEIGSDADSSINALYNIVNDISTLVGQHDSSITENYNLLQIHEGSLGNLETRITLIESSIGELTDWNNIQDNSINDLRGRIEIIDGSIIYLTNITNIHDGSIGELQTDVEAIESSLGDYVRKDGDTMSGDLIVPGVDITNDLSVGGNAIVSGDMGIKGDLTVDGSLTYIHTDELDVSTGYIHLNTGLNGIPPSTLQSGIVVGRGTEEPYVFLYDETDQTFRIGIAQETSTGYLDSSTQAVATREDTPVINGIAVWNDIENRFDTFTSLKYTDVNGLDIDVSLKLDAYSGSEDLILVVGTDGYVKSIPTYDNSINDLYEQLIVQDTSVKGAMNIGDGSAAVYSDITNDGSLQFREFIGVSPAIVNQNGDLIEISIDASFGGEVNTASNIGSGEGLSVTKEGSDLPFKTIDTNDPSSIIITADNSTLYIDVSIADASLVGLTDTSIDETSLKTHSNIEYDASLGKWINTNNIRWDNSLGTTTDDIGGIIPGTDLSGLTLKEILYKILYEYQIPTLSVGSDPVDGIYEKGLVSTQFSNVDVSWNSTNANYPLAKLNNIAITKTGSGTIYEASLGLVNSDSNTYTDSAGILNWGGLNRTIVYNIEIDDDQSGQTQPAVINQLSYTFYYRQYWGIVDGNTNLNQVDSDMIIGLSNSRLAGETDLNATFTNPGTGFIKYLFAYPDTVAAPDNFGLLSEINDQNEFNITDSFSTENEDVSVGNNNIRYRFYLSNNKIDTSEFDITFKF